MTILDIFLKGGPLMYVLAVLSFFALAIIIGKYRQIIKINGLHKKLAKDIAAADTTEGINAIIKAQTIETPLSVVLLKANSLMKEDYNLIKDSIETTANIAIHKMESGMGWLSTISAIAPLVGFLGTVTGMVKVFINIAAHSQNGIDITYLSSGIWEALLTTVGGLVVGIPAIMFYNDLVSHIENTTKLLQEQIDEYMIKYRTEHR
jgi:biopolymer transport protein ExbB